MVFENKCKLPIGVFNKTMSYDHSLVPQMAKLLINHLRKGVRGVCYGTIQRFFCRFAIISAMPCDSLR